MRLRNQLIIGVLYTIACFLFILLFMAFALGLKYGF